MTEGHSPALTVERAPTGIRQALAEQLSAVGGADIPGLREIIADAEVAARELAVGFSQIVRTAHFDRGRGRSDHRR